MIARSVGRLRSGATLAVLFIVAACGHTSDWNEQDSSPNRVFAEGYRNLWEQYIHPVDLSAMSLAGLNQLKDLDPALDISRPADMVVLTADDAPIARWRPPDDDDFVGWARLTTDALMAARAASSMLRKRATNELSDEIFRGVMTTFDRYSRYADPQQARLGRAVREGFGGLGITISHRDGKTTIQKVHADTPAERVGLLKQDRITHVDRKPIDGLDQLQVVSVLRGLVNSEVVLSINRPGVDHPFDVSLVREMIVIPTVSVKREGEIVVVKISGFNQGTSASVRRELRRVERELGSGLKGIVLDLRDNPGGLLDQAVEVADLFLNDGRVISTIGRHPRSHQAFDADWGELAAHKPLAVLVNGRSASAAEIVAGALHDLGRAVVVGSTTYGKGTVQTIVTLPNGSELTFTWAEMLAPSGVAIQNHGIFPAICTSGDPARVHRLLAAFRSGRDPDAGLLAQSTKARRAARKDPAQARKDCPPDATDAATDTEIAKLLILNTKLYTSILARARPRIALRGSSTGAHPPTP